MKMQPDQELQPHPLALAFPAVADGEFARLLADIKAHGQQHPIALYHGQILDGRARYRAARLLDVIPQTVTVVAAEPPIEQLIEANLRSRRLNLAQRAVVAARLCATLRSMTRRSRRGLYERLGKLCDVSYQSVRAATTILAHGTADEIARAEAGTLSLNPVMSEIKRGMAPEERAKQPHGRGKKLRPLSIAGRRVYEQLTTKPPRRLLAKPAEPKPPKAADAAPPAVTSGAALGNAFVAWLVTQVRWLPNIPLAHASALLDGTQLTAVEIDRVAEWLMEVAQALRKPPQPDALTAAGWNGPVIGFDSATVTPAAAEER